MKSIKQQYIDLHEGKMSQANFMRNLRMTMPQYVTNVTSFGDAVKILKNKGILSEIFVKENKDPMQQGYDAFQMEDSKNPYPPQSEEAQLWLQGWGKAQEEEQDSNSYDYPEDAGDDEYPRDYDNIDDFNDGEFWESLNEKNLDVDQEELKKGIEVEKEHTDDPVKAEEIALDHLKEDPKYYSKLTKAGLEEDKDAMLTAAEELAKQMGDKASAIVALEDEMGLSHSEASRIAASVYPGLEEEYDSDEDEREKEEKADNMVNQRLEDEDEEMKKIDAIIKKYKEEESGKYTTGGEQFSIKESKSKWENTSGKSMYAQFKEIDNLNGQEVLIGIDYEIECNPELSKKEAIKLVLKKLKKNPIYYTATLMAGKEMNEIPTIGKLKPGSDQMRELKGEDSLVDKDNGMKPIKDVQKIKASSNKATKETNKPVKNISLMSLIAKSVRGMKKMDATGEKMKIIKLKEGYYQTNVKLNPEEQTQIKKVLPDAEFEWDEDDRKQVISSNKSEQEIQNIVDQVLGLGPVKSGNKQSGVAKFLTKEDLMEMIREELEEALGAFGGDNVTDVNGHQIDEKTK